MHILLCKIYCVRKIVNDGLFKTFNRALPSGTVWVVEPSPFVVSGVANFTVKHGGKYHIRFLNTVCCDMMTLTT